MTESTAPETIAQAVRQVDTWRDVKTKGTQHWFLNADGTQAIALLNFPFSTTLYVDQLVPIPGLAGSVVPVPLAVFEDVDQMDPEALAAELTSVVQGVK